MNSLSQELSKIRNHSFYGKVTSIQGLLITVRGIDQLVSIGSRCVIETRSGEVCSGEVIGFKENETLVMSFYDLEGVGLGCRVIVEETESEIYPDESWLGRILNPMGEPIDGKGPLIRGEVPYKLRSSPPLASERSRLGTKIDLGVRSINTFITCCRGQRMGIFSGSGIGKSTLLAMMARNTNAEVNVIGLIGERGREVRDFIEEALGEEGLKKAVVVVATSNSPSLVRLKSAFVATAIAEWFRDQGKKVVFMMDSSTRFARAQREIGLAIGEPPARQGYPPSVFYQIPRLMERTGNNEHGSITALYTILVQGGDMEEPIADEVRGILDGHIILNRELGARNHWPAIDILPSLSRVMNGIVADQHNAAAAKLREVLANYEKQRDLILLGAYQYGTDPKTDYAIDKIDEVEAFLKQGVIECDDYETTIQKLTQLFADSL